MTVDSSTKAAQSRPPCRIGPVRAAGGDACHSIPGLAGYIGFDLILTPDSRRLVVVEANPRLTTAYLGYRELAKENLAIRMLQLGRRPGRSMVCRQHRIHTGWAMPT